MEIKLETTAMWFHRGMPHISWKNRVNREEVDEQNQGGPAELSWKNRDNVVTGTIEDERGKGKPQLNYMRSLSQLLHVSHVEIIGRTRYGGEWKTMATNVRTGLGSCKLLKRKERGGEREKGYFYLIHLLFSYLPSRIRYEYRETLGQRSNTMR